MIQLGAKDNNFSFKTFLFVGIFFFGIIYWCLVSWHLSSVKKQVVSQVEKHAAIIADDLWNLNNSGMRAYLDLATRTDHYKIIDVLTENGEIFISIPGPPLNSVDRVLLRIGLIYTEQVSHPVFHNKEKIGSLRGERYTRDVYSLVYIFLILFFITLTLVFIFHLIFNRRLLEQQVRERTRRYHELVNLLPEMVLETDANGFVTFANINALERLGLSDPAETEIDCREYIRLENGSRSDNTMYLQPSEGGDLDSNEYRAQGADGRLFPVLVRSAPIYNKNQLAGARMVIVDISKRKALEEQLTRDQKMKSIGMMAGGVAHDLNNILSGIVNYPELILHQLPQDSPLIKLINPMKEAGLRAAAVVADLLTVARGVAASREIADLNSIILDYTKSPEFERLQSLYPDIHYSTLLSPNIGSISCSIIHVRKCLMNLVTNASEALKGAGEVSIETANATIDAPVQTVHGAINPGSYIVLAVKDTGPGISLYELSHIFEPFYSKKELGRSGTGLGLTIVWNTILDHDGGIQVISTESGSLFELYFPQSPDSAEEVVPQGDVDVLRGNGESILIVDDELQQRDIASRILESLGYSVKSVASGEAALDYIRSNRVDLVLLDMVLESGMNGLHIYEEIIRMYPDQKAIIMSGFSESDDVRNTMLLGAGGLVKKPYTKEELAKAVFAELS